MNNISIIVSAKLSSKIKFLDFTDQNLTYGNIDIQVVDKYNISFEKIKELPFDPTVEFLIPSNIPNIVDIKIPELHRIEVDYPEERKLFENGIKQLFVSILSSKTYGFICILIH